MNIYLYLLVIISGGAFGGILECLKRFQYESETGFIKFQGGKINTPRVTALLFINAILGVGGALAIQFITISIGKFNDEKSLENIILVFSLSVVAGFSGRKMLNIVSNKLEDQVGEATRKSEEALEEAEESMLLTEAIAMLGPHSTAGERVKSIQKLDLYLKANPKERKATILAGRLYRKDNNFDKAIEVLSRFIDVKKKYKEIDKDLADVLYNRSCYRLLKIVHQSSVEDENEKAIAIQDLKESILISPENKKDAETDNDFELIWERAEFKSLKGD